MLFPDELLRPFIPRLLNRGGAPQYHNTPAATITFYPLRSTSLSPATYNEVSAIYWNYTLPSTLSSGFVLLSHIPGFESFLARCTLFIFKHSGQLCDTVPPLKTMADSVTTVEYNGRVAVLTIRNEAKLNALTQQQYYDIAQKLREIATHDEVFVTVFLAKGRFFSAYA